MFSFSIYGAFLTILIMSGISVLVAMAAFEARYFEPAKSQVDQ